MRSNQIDTKPIISYFIIMGDSLSDRGTMEQRHLFNIIPMASLSGLAGKSPQGSFTNGFPWSDFISATLANEFMIAYFTNQRLAEKEVTSLYSGRDACDIADNIISDTKFKYHIDHAYSLTNDLYVRYKGQDFIRSYVEGGLTAHSYRWKPDSSINRFFSRFILSTLDKKRDLLLAYDQKHYVSTEQKAKTLIIEWSGANDLITVNAEPTITESTLAIKDKMNNVNALINNGYRHFIIFNLPDLSLTPRFQNKEGERGKVDRQNAHNISLHFNTLLQTECQSMQTQYPHCTIGVFDVSSIFTNVINHPEKFPCHFEKSKMKTPYQTSKDFHSRNGISPASGYLFWDDVHPTADMHAILALDFYTTCKKIFSFIAPEPPDAATLFAMFKSKYEKCLENDIAGICGLFKTVRLPPLPANPQEAINIILYHALYQHGHRTRQVITDLQWIDNKGNINMAIPALEIASKIINLGLTSSPT